MTTPPATPPALLRDPAFLRLWAGTTASGLATWALPFLLGLAVLDGGLSAVELGVALAARTAGFLVAVPVAGVLADRHSRRAVVGWSAGAAAAASPAIAAGLSGSVLLVAVASAVVGAGQGACRPAFQALTAEVVEADRRQRANAATTLAVRVSVLVAPGATALLALAVDLGALVVGTGVLWVLAAALPPRGVRRSRTGRGGASFLRELGEGVAEARRHRWFTAGLGALTAVIATGYSATAVVLPLVARDRYGSGAVLAAATTAYPVGALLGALLIARWHPHAPGWVALAGLGLYALAPLALLLPVPAAVLVAAYVLVGLGIELFNVPWFTALQREVEPRLLARVSSVDFLLSYGLAPLGLALVAPALDAFGAAPTLLACTVVCVLGPAAAALAPGARGFRRPHPQEG